MHISEMSDVVMVKRIMMMLVMGAGFQFSSLTSGVVGQSVTAGDQQQSHYSSIVTQAQSTTQNNTHRHTYLIIVADAADAVSVNFSGWCKFLQI